MMISDDEFMTVWHKTVSIRVFLNSYSHFFYSHASISVVNWFWANVHHVRIFIFAAQGRTHAPNYDNNTITTIYGITFRLRIVSHCKQTLGHKGECWMPFMHCPLLPGLTFNLWFGNNIWFFFCALMLLSLCVCSEQQVRRTKSVPPFTRFVWIVVFIFFFYSLLLSTVVASVSLRSIFCTSHFWRSLSLLLYKFGQR